MGVESVTTRRKWVWIANGEISGQSARSCSYRGIELEVSTLGLPHRTCLPIDTRNRVRSTARSLVVRPTERSVLCMSRSQEPGCLLCTESRYKSARARPISGEQSKASPGAAALGTTCISGAPAVPGLFASHHLPKSPPRGKRGLIHISSLHPYTHRSGRQ